MHPIKLDYMKSKKQRNGDRHEVGREEQGNESSGIGGSSVGNWGGPFWSC